jgi:hypothetical protein
MKIMKNKYFIGFSIIFLNACSHQTKGDLCKEILSQRSNILFNTNYIKTPALEQTDSLYVKCGCDTLK